MPFLKRSVSFYLMKTRQNSYSQTLSSVDFVRKWTEAHEERNGYAIQTIKAPIVRFDLETVA